MNGAAKCCFINSLTPVITFESTVWPTCPFQRYADTHTKIKINVFYINSVVNQTKM